MPIEAVKIPQNVYVEDRLIGPITLKQLFIVGIGAGISYVIFAAVTKTGVNNIVISAACWSPTLVAAMFAFLKINDLSLFNIILLVVEGWNKPSTRYWSPHTGLSINLITTQHAKAAVDATAKATQNADKLADITRQMEKRQAELDRLTAHETPVPAAVEPSSPVRADRVQAEGLDPEKSIDGVASMVSRFDHLIANSPAL